MSPAGPPGPNAPATVPALLAAATASDPGRPRLTWYGADGERVELSARVLANWVAKTANLLLEELLDPTPWDAPPLVVLDLPVHWRSVVWGLAASAVGARVLSDWTDAVVLSRALAGRGTRAKVVGFAVLWGAFCLGALAVDES